ncbi:MAG: hypothetical protein GX131_15830 [candidate division WS1 bacterium]|jgi:uncharacterized protein involved in exopolysaccharide biosynthesis|nr:hypothetical protein [candidate division WS1 bacterium]
MRLIERYNWFHVLIVSLLGGVLIGAAAHFLLPGYFTASSSLLLNDRPDILATVAPTAEAAAAGPSLERLQAILVSRALRERIIEKHSLEQKLQVNLGEALDALLEMTSIRAIGADGVSVTVTAGGYFAPRIPFWGYPVHLSEARTLSAEIANSYISELDAYLREVNLGTTTETREFLQQRESELQAELDNTEDRLESLRAQYELIDPDSKAARVGDQMRVLEQARADAAAEADAAASSLGVAEGQLSAIEARRIASAVESRNPIISSLQEQLAGLNADIARELASGKTREHRDVMQIQSRIDSLEAQLGELQETLVRDVTEQPNPLHDATIQRVVELRVQLAGARARRSEISSLLSSAESEMAEMPAVAREYVEIQRVQTVAAEQLSAIQQALWLARYDQARTEVGAPFTVLDTAIAPTERRGPPTVLAGAIAFVILVLLQGLLIIDRRWFGG